jgi:hypothetical protein
MMLMNNQQNDAVLGGRKDTPQRVRECVEIRTKAAQAGLLTDNMFDFNLRQTFDAFIRQGQSQHVFVRSPAAPKVRLEVTLSAQPNGMSGATLHVDRPQR